MSGPLGGRMLPPHTSFIHYLWPGSVKLAPFPNLPLFGGYRRSWLDVVLYAALLFSLARTLVLPELYTEDFLPIILLLPLCALGDKTIPLAARVEHHFAMLWRPAWSTTLPC